MLVGNYFWLFPDLFSVAPPGKTCAIHHPSFYLFKDIRCISCSSDWEVRSSQNRVYPTYKEHWEVSKLGKKTTCRSQLLDEYRNQPGLDKSKDKERDQIEGRGTALVFFFHVWSVWCTLCRIHMTALKSTHWGSQTGSAIGDHLIKDHDIEPDNIAQSLNILRNCQNKLQCLIFEMLFIKKKNWNHC